NNMTHELKTPISTISLSTNVLLKPGIENQPERIRNYAEIIKKENERLQLQVEKVLQIASLDKDKVEMQFETCNLFELVSDSVSTFKTIIEENSGTITSNIANKNIEVKLDKIHIYNVLSNLIDNAIKYCDTNPEIEIAVYEKGNNIEIHVQDNGTGMKPSEVKYIFDKFYRVPTGNLHNVKGFGLGLYYAKVIMQAHNGSISVEKNEPIGSAFILKIPRSK
ncbi:HAMP domain-containing histidine kinase, partial [Salibacteraceae bacterium]|nr:HAMP domain-containing histidine kinase [Salibacteraceae bacterium]